MSSYTFSKSSRMCLIKISQPSIFSFAMPFSFSLSSFHCMALKKNDKIHISVQPPSSPKLKMAGFLLPNLRAVTLIPGSLASALSSFSVMATTWAGVQMLFGCCLKSRGTHWSESRGCREWGEMSEGGDKAPTIPFGTQGNCYL